MNCEQHQRRLLGTANPDDPPPDVAAHLAECPACRAWQRQLVRIERHVSLLPAPPSEGKARFLLQLQSEPGLLLPPTLPLPSRRAAWRRLPFSVGGVAAAVAVLAGGIVIAALMFRSKENPPEDVQAVAPPKARAAPTRRAETPRPEPATTLVARLMECDLRLAQADTPRGRVQTLADLADALRDEAKTLGQAAAPEALETVAQMYKKVVHEGIVQHARALAPTERREVLNPIAARLARVEHDVEEEARSAGPTATAERLRHVAMVAREGDAQLRVLVQGGAP